tara:strand:+ start:790 stop:1500 length:711 start_codon:yes stop_codon:yes gene_type:complete
MQPKRLQLGASRFSKTTSKALELFTDGTWTHLGDAKGNEGLIKHWVFKSLILRPLVNLVRARKGKPSMKTALEAYKRCNFFPWVFEPGDRLDFPDDTFTFIFSEHLLEHFQHEVANSLIREMARVLMPGGVLRICVPDAKLRNYLPPEPEGYPEKLPWDHPEKHKVRWTMYSLSDALIEAGLNPIALQYCDTDSNFYDNHPETLRGSYPDTADKMVFSYDYMKRFPSLIVDGVKAS